MKINKYNPVKSVIRKLEAIRANPSKICLGYAFGVFMSTTPLIGFKWIVALPIVHLAKWDKIACMIGVFQINYFTGPFFYALAYFIGKEACGYRNNFVLPDKLNFNVIKDIFFSNADIFISITVGGLILSVPMTIGAYYLAKSLFSGKNPTTL